MTEIESKYVQKTYDQIAKHFDNTRSYKWSWIGEFIDSLDKNNSKVIDIGCGNGRNMQYDECIFTGVDSCQQFVDICLSKNLNCIKSDMCELPFDNESFDAILCIASFHHLGNVERRNKSLQEMKRILKSGGKILLSVWSKNQPKKTRRIFESYGDTYVKWNKDGKVYDRYYYIFEIDEIKNHFINNGLRILSHTWDCGNDIFILEK